MPFRPIQHPGPLQGKTVVVVFNENARDGAVAKEYPEAERVLRGLGATVHGVRTVPDPEVRRGKIFCEMVDLLQAAKIRPQHPQRIHQELPPLLIMPYGGDSTIWETVRQSVMAAGISLTPQQDPLDLSEYLGNRFSFFLVDKGKAGDNAKQVKAPEKVADFPAFAKRAVELPSRFTIIETQTPQSPHYEVAGHSYSLGVGGYLFARREENLVRNPGSFWNKGLKSYFRLLPHAALNRYGLLGFEAEVKHYDADGVLKQSTTKLASELMITPNRLIAKVGGVPGAWGETKLIMLPPGGGGLLGLGEYVFRGIATKMGWNQVSPEHSMRTISADREIRVAPGEWLEVVTRVPNTFTWDMFRYGQEKFKGSAATDLGWIYRRLGIDKAGPAIPPAGALMEVPTILNGDVAPPHPRFKVYAPDYSLNQLAHPDSLAVGLARDSALLEGKSPLISDQQLVARIIPEESPKILESDGMVERVRTPFLSLRRLDQALTDRQFKATTERVSELLVATQGVEKPADLARLANRDLTVGKVYDFLASRQDEVGKHLGRRVWQHGMPLAAGVGALFAGEALADRIGLDPDIDREIRFGLMMYLGHAVQANFQPLWEVYANRALGHPYDFVRTRQVRVASELLAQWTFSHHRRLIDAMGASWRSGALGLETGVQQSMLGKVSRVGAIPLRGAWNMGHGLIFSRMTEGLLQALDAPQLLKDYASPAAFFAPDIGRILFPKATIGMFHHRGINLGARIFAAGFIADMGFAGLQHGNLGADTRRERQINQVAAELRRRSGEDGFFQWRPVLRFLSPTLADHIDSHEYGFGRANVYHRLAEKN